MCPPWKSGRYSFPQENGDTGWIWRNCRQVEGIACVWGFSHPCRCGQACHAPAGRCVREPRGLSSHLAPRSPDGGPHLVRWGRAPSQAALLLGKESGFAPLAPGHTPSHLLRDVSPESPLILHPPCFQLLGDSH